MNSLLLQSHGTIDPESLETQNDDSIAALEGRVGLLRNVRPFSPFFNCSLSTVLTFLHTQYYYKQITAGIHAEADSHHALLDRMSRGIGGAQLGLGATVAKVKKVMDDAQGRKTVYMALGVTFALFILYLWAR